MYVLFWECTEWRLLETGKKVNSENKERTITQQVELYNLQNRLKSKGNDSATVYFK
jgi:hypothetical protein